eukprot:7226384-Karenia_brevis.AAC.1
MTTVVTGHFSQSIVSFFGATLMLLILTGEDHCGSLKGKDLKVVCGLTCITTRSCAKLVPAFVRNLQMLVPTRLGTQFTNLAMEMRKMSRRGWALNKVS